MRTGTSSGDGNPTSENEKREGLEIANPRQENGSGREPHYCRKGTPAVRVRQGHQVTDNGRSENDMSERPAWHLDVKTAQEEVRVCFAKWQELTNRIQKIVEGHEAYAPDAFKTSLQELTPEYKRAANAVVARLSIMAQIKCGEMRLNGGEPEESSD